MAAVIARVAKSATGSLLHQTASWRHVNFDLYSAGRCFSIRARTSAKVSRVRMSGMVSGPRHGRDQSGRGKAQSYAILYLQSRRAVRSSGFFSAQ
jgi:hypothetical protein